MITTVDPTPAGLVAPGTLDAQTTRLKDLKIRGYVTSVVSATEFEIEDYRITRDTGFVIDLENPDPGLKFNPEDIRIGVELESRGTFNDATGELTAKSINQLAEVKDFPTIH